MISTLQVIRRFIFEEWGGTETVVWNTSRILKRKDHPVKILATSALGNAGKEIKEEIEILRFPYFYPYLNLNKNNILTLDKKGGDPYSLQLYRYMNNQKGIDLIHCHTMNRIAASVRLTAKRKNIPYIVSFHGGHFDVPKEEMEQMIKPYRKSINYGRFIDLLIKKERYLKDADGIICVGFNEYELARKKFPDKLVYYLPNGVDVEKFNQEKTNLFRRNYGISDEEKVILCVSRLDYQKNQLQLVELIEQLVKSGENNTRLVLIGPVTSESYFKKIEETTTKLKLNHKIIIIKGLKADDPLLISAYNSSDVFILPSVHEPFGIVVLEAWASKLPVIAASTGGLKKLINSGKNGLLFDGSLEDLLRQYLKLGQKDRLREDLIANSFQEVFKNYTWTAVSEKLIEYYEEITRNFKSRRK